MNTNQFSSAVIRVLTLKQDKIANNELYFSNGRINMDKDFMSNNLNINENKKHVWGIKFFDKKYSQWWRGIAAVFIMIGHLIPNDAPYYINFFFTGSIWVGIFFFYSGYGLQFSIDNNEKYLDDFIPRKLRDVYLPFIIAETIYYFIVNILLKKYQMIFIDTLLYVTGIKLANTVLWYIVELLIIYFIFYLINHFKINNKVWIAIYVVFLIFAVLIDLGAWWYLSSFCFLLGIYYKQIEKIFYSVRKRINWICLLLVFCTFYTLIKVIPLINAEYIHRFQNYLIVAVTMITCPFFVFVAVGITERFYKYMQSQLLGSISYEIYLYHLLVAELIWTLTGKTMPAVVVIVPTTIVISFGMNRIKSAVCGLLSSKDRVK